MEPDQTSSDTSAASTIKPKTRSVRVIEAFDMIPVIGKPSAWVYKHWGPTGLTSLFAGLLLGVGLSYFGALPNGLVADSYKGGAKKSTSGIRLTSFEADPLPDPKPEWLQPYSDWLDDEAAAKRSEGTRAGVGAVIAPALQSTQRFKWELKALPGFDLNGRAFKVTADGYVKMLEPIKNQQSIYFEVPECNQGDKIVGLILATWKGSQTQVDIMDTFRSSVVPEGR